VSENIEMENFALPEELLVSSSKALASENIIVDGVVTDS
jgi:hypothetical protein